MINGGIFEIKASFLWCVDVQTLYVPMWCFDDNYVPLWCVGDKFSRPSTWCI